MPEYRPLSKRGVPDADLDDLHEEVEPWMIAPLISWLRPFLWIRARSGDVSRLDFIERLEMAHRERLPFDRHHIRAAGDDAELRIRQSKTAGLDIANFLLGDIRNFPGINWSDRARALAELLRQSGSAWEVTTIQDEDSAVFTLTRRDLAAAKDAIAETISTSERAGRHLTSAWQAIATRDPSPGIAYDQAIKAVEAAAHPVVSPNNARATLGTMLSDLKAAPTKWTFVLGDLDPIIVMAETLWKGHVRHGTDPRPDHTTAEADAAVHLAIPLVRFFAGGLVSPS